MAAPAAVATAVAVAAVAEEEEEALRASFVLFFWRWRETFYAELGFAP